METVALIWSGEGEDQDGDWHAEFAEVAPRGGGLRASGVQLGAIPIPYRLDYELDAEGDGFVTRSLQLKSAGRGWERRLTLARSVTGEWTIDATFEGKPGLPDPGGDEGSLAGALDCDIALSPLTNAMPVHRHRLAAEPGQAEFLMAWISVPDLAVRPSRQRYTHLGRSEGAATVRFEELGGEGVVFVSDLEFAEDGLVTRYPKLARRVRETPA